MRRRSARGAILGLAVLLSGSCGKDAADVSRASRLAASRAGLPVRVAFQPPADGLLTEAHVDRYIRVRRAAKGRPEEDAARAVGVDPDEFGWIRARVDEALLEADRRRVRTFSEEVYGKTIASLRESRRNVRDEKTARGLDEQIAGLERERAALRRADDVPPALAANARRVASRRGEIDGLP